MLNAKANFYSGIWIIFSQLGLQIQVKTCKQKIMKSVKTLKIVPETSVSKKIVLSKILSANNHRSVMLVKPRPENNSKHN
jgi:hypothetical protein